MARQIFEYTKTVLTKVSFNSDLFCKEVEKGFSRLLPYEIEELSIWIKEFIEHKPELYSCRVLLPSFVFFLIF
jgi:DNA replication protein DnaD